MSGAKTTITVLVVDDDPVVSEQICSQATALGHRVVGSAYDAAEAVRLTREIQPDVVLMDLKMLNPETGRDDPRAGLRATREIMRCCPTAIILVTAYESSELIQQASRMGIGAYLIKPVRDNELERAIVIARARYEDLMALRFVNRELAEANQELDAFAQTVAHELKNPLAIFKGYTEVLCGDFDSVTEREREQSCANISRTVHRMEKIIAELLLLAQVRQTEVEMVPLDMGEILLQARQRLAGAIADSGAEIVAPDEWPSALGYAPWVEEVWVNYLSNALKYGGQPPRVELGATRLPDSAGDGRSMVRFWVRDNGAGIDPEDQVQLFIPFRRLGRVRTSGHGLGLSIVRRIVKKLGGQVMVESEVGRGSVFGFSLPSAR